MVCVERMSSSDVSHPLVSRWAADVGALRPEDPNFALPTTLTPHLSLWRLVAHGGALVYEGFDRRTGDRVAVKLFASLSGDEERARVLPEAARCGNIDHAALPKVLDASMLSDGTPYTVSEFAFGQSLASRSREPLPPAVACDVASQILGALQALHALPAAHGGVAPANVLLDGEPTRWQVHLVGAAIPFGRISAAAVDPEGGNRLAYWAPELFSELKATVRADLYAVGLLLHEMLTGVCPQASLSAEAFAVARTNDAIDGRWLAQAGVSSALSRVVLTALSRDPQERFASAQEMLCELHAARADESCLWRISATAMERVDRVDPSSHSASSLLPSSPLDSLPAPQMAIDSSVWGVLPDAHADGDAPSSHGGIAFRAWLIGFSATLAAGGALLFVSGDETQSRATMQPPHEVTDSSESLAEAPGERGLPTVGSTHSAAVQVADSERPMADSERPQSKASSDGIRGGRVSAGSPLTGARGAAAQVRVPHKAVRTSVGQAGSRAAARARGAGEVARPSATPARASESRSSRAHENEQGGSFSLPENPY